MYPTKVHKKQSVKNWEIKVLPRKSVWKPCEEMVYETDVEALRKVYLGIKLFPDFLLLFPERLGLIGFDVTGWTKMAVPEITSIMIPAYQEGRIASQKLIEMIESKNSISNKKIVIKNAVRWRDSTL